MIPFVFLYLAFFIYILVCYTELKIFFVVRNMQMPEQFIRLWLLNIVFQIHGPGRWAWFQIFHQNFEAAHMELFSFSKRVMVRSAPRPNLMLQVLLHHHKCVRRGWGQGSGQVSQVFAKTELGMLFLHGPGYLYGAMSCWNKERSYKLSEGLKDGCCCISIKAAAWRHLFSGPKRPEPKHQSSTPNIVKAYS